MLQKTNSVMNQQHQKQIEEQNQNKPDNQIKKDFIASLKYSIAAGGSSVIVKLLHPLDIVKTRFQSHDGQLGRNLVPKYNSILNAFQTIYKDEGIKGFYKGVVWSLFASSLSQVLFFTIYENNKKYFARKNNNHLSDRHVLYSSIISGVLSTVITTPLWSIKTRVLLNTKQNISEIQNVKNQVSSIYKEHGIQGYWRGLSVSLPLCFHGMIQMFIFEKTLQIQKHLNFLSESDQIYDEKHHDVKNNSKQASVSGFISKISAIMVTYPLQTLRTRLQQSQYNHNNLAKMENISKQTPKYLNFRDLVYKMYKQEGLKSFYKGVTPSLLMNAPSNAIYFFFYEIFKQKLNIQNQNRLE